MNSYKRTFFTVLILTVIGVVSYITFNAYNFETTAATDQITYSKVRIYAKSESDFNRMLNAGLVIDHANRKPGHFMDAELSSEEINLLRNSGVPFDILISDLDAYQKSLPRMTQSEIDAQMQQVYEKDNITHSIFGTMRNMGYLKYTEVVSKLDSMRLEYPQFISQKFSIGTSYENRTIWAVRVTKNPDAPTGKPEVYYHALIHAREPESMQTQVYYMYWLFENYNTNPIARYILNNREIYWIPVFNPDGYVYNETYSSGLWRKNRKPCSGSIGTDLNRNFGIYEFWNAPNGGSSSSCGATDYRGPLPFSEPESQAVMNFFNSRNFRAGFGAHTHGNWLIKPWAYCDPVPTPDDAMFNLFIADLKASYPIYIGGTPYQTVGYRVRGCVDDWCYNDSGHTKAFIMTPETGQTFWPQQSLIIPLAQGMLFNNTYMSLVAGPYVSYLSSSFNQPTYTPGQSGTFRVRFMNKGVLASNNTHIILTPGNGNVTIPTQQYDYNLGVHAQDSAAFNFTVSPSAPNNCYIPATLTFKQDTSTIYTQGVYIPVGTPTSTVILNDQANNFSNWTAGGSAATWNTSTTQYHSSPSSFSESPSGNYGADVDMQMILTTPLDISDAPVVTLSFWHRYATEINYDFCFVEVSSDGGNNWQLIATYHGTLSTWTQQTFDISRFANATTQLKVRFRLMSDQNTQADGWYIDDIVITKYCVGTPLAIQGNNNIPDRFALEQNYPNPFNPVTQIKYALAKDEFVKITVFDILGREVASLVNRDQKAGRYSVEFDGSRFASGMYMYKISAGSFTDVKKMMLIK